MTTYTQRMARADGCPSCVANLQPPYRVETERGGYRAYYHCGGCGHCWFTSWAED